MSLTKVNKKDSTTVKGNGNLSCMSRVHILLNKYLNNTPPLKSFGKIPLKQQSGTSDTRFLDFRELLPFKSFCLGTLLRVFFFLIQQLKLSYKAVLDAIRSLPDLTHRLFRANS